MEILGEISKQLNHMHNILYKIKLGSKPLKRLDDILYKIKLGSIFYNKQCLQICWNAYGNADTTQMSSIRNSLHFPMP